MIGKYIIIWSWLILLQRFKGLWINAFLPFQLFNLLYLKYVACWSIKSRPDHSVIDIPLILFLLDNVGLDEDLVLIAGIRSLIEYEF